MASGEKVLFFAYGPAMDEKDFKRWMTVHKFRGTMRKEISGAWLVDHTLKFHYKSDERKGGIADVVSEPGSAVPGVLCSIDEKHQEALDAHEGAPGVFERHEVTVCTTDLKLVKAITYKLKEEHRLAEHVRPNRKYEDLIKKGLEKYELPTELLFNAGTKFVEEENINHVFVYGTTQRGQRENRIMNTPKKPKGVEKAKCKGTLYDLGNFPGLTPGDKWVKGEVYIYDKGMTDNLKELDSIIGNEGTFQRVVMQVKIASSGKALWAWAYLLSEGEYEESKKPIATGDWIHYLVKGRR